MSTISSVESAEAAPETAEASVSAIASRAANNDHGGGRGPSEIRQQEILAINPSTEARAAAKALGLTDYGTIELTDLKVQVLRLALPSGLDAETARSILQEGRTSELFAFNHIYRHYRSAKGKGVGATETNGGDAGAAPCLGSECFNQAAIGWQSSLAACAGHTRIGVLDTAVDLTHPALAGRSIVTTHFTATGMTRSPASHGTSVLALLAGAADGPVPGLLPDADYFAADVFSTDTEGRLFADTFSLLAGLEWVRGQDVRIINLSFTGPRDPLMEVLIEKLASRGVLMVAAAGNQGPSAPPSYPAAYPQVIAVTAINKDLRSYTYANRGDYIDIAQPGVDIWTALPGGKVGRLSGTSFAAPHAVAILATLQATGGPLTKQEALRHMSVQDLGEPGTDPVFGRGLLLAPSHCQQVAIQEPAPSLQSWFGLPVMVKAGAAITVAAGNKRQ